MRYEEKMNRTLQAIPPSGIRKFFDLVSEMKDAISLGVGEPDFVTPWRYSEAAIYAIEKGETHYTSNWGLLPLRKEIRLYLEKRFGVSYREENEILVTVGASEGIDLSMRTLLNPGDEVVLPLPSYVSYAPLIRLSGGVPVGIPCKQEEGFIVTPQALESVLTERTRVLILPYPNNPTGAIMTKEELSALLPLIRKHDLMVVSDEIYAELTYSGRHVSFASLEDMQERTLTLNGFSKSFAMTGWRLGYVCGPAPILSQMCKIHQYAILCAGTQSQYAALEALRTERENGYRQVEEMRSVYHRRRNLMLSGFTKMGLSCFPPQGAFYVFPNIQSTSLSSFAFCEELLKKEKVACVPGDAFGENGEGFIRCSYATSNEKLAEALLRMQRFVKSTKR